MGGNLQPLDFGKEGVSVRVQSIGKQLGNMITTKLARRQADIVDHQQRDFVFGPGVAVG